MKLPRIGFLALALAFAATLLYVTVGFGSVKDINVCAVKAKICEVSDLIANYKGGEILANAKATKPTFTGKLSVTCKESTVTALATGVSAVEATKIAFSGCEGGCTTATATAPAKGEGVATSEGNGTLTLPLTVTLSGCTGGAKCIFTNSKASLAGLGSLTEPSTSASKVILTKTEGGEACGTTSEFTAKYVLTEAIERLLEVEDVSFEAKLPLSGFVESEHE